MDIVRRKLMLVTIGTNIVHTIRTGLLLCLSPPWRPLCVIGRLGTKKKKALMAQWKRGKEGSEAPAFSLFRLSPERFLLFDYWDTRREPLRREELLCAYTVYVQ